MSRIVAGVAGGRRLATPRGRGTRPTSERVREGLFSTLVAMIGPLDDVAFLDLYAGSGAVGLEAASRGARPVVLVESAPDAVRVARANVQALGLDAVTVVAGSVASYLASTPTVRFGVVYLDPPYADPVEPALDQLARAGQLDSEAVVVVERASRDGDLDWPEGLVPDRQRRYGDSTLWYGRRP